jgi:hypothetical protein
MSKDKSKPNKKSKSDKAKKNKKKKALAAEREKRIAVAAYLKALERNFECNCRVRDWLEAEQEVDAQSGR